MLEEKMVGLQVGGVAPKEKLNFNAVYYQVIIIILL
jgi:hypothetical protein